MKAMDLLARLDALGVSLLAEDGKLRVSAQRGQIDDEIKLAIGAHKAELLELLAMRERDASPAVRSIERGAALSLSFFQERLWVLQRLEPLSTAFNIVAYWPAPAGVDTARLLTAIEAVFARHEILRSIFIERDGVPVVRVLDPSQLRIEVLDLREFAEVEQKARCRQEIDAAVHRPFDLSRESPAHCTVFRFDDHRALIMLATHHIAVDAWSIGLLQQEVAARCVDAAPANCGGELQYVDFADWQRRTQDAHAIASDLEWYGDRLKGAPPVSTFPPDCAPSQHATGATFDFVWDIELSAKLRALARDEGVTTYMLLTAACAAVLRAQTGQDEVVLGSPMGVRERPELERMIGPFVNLQVMRLSLQDDPSFSELLKRARDAVFDAHEHRHVPFEKLIERIKPVRSLDHAPLFQIAIVQHNATAQEELSIVSGGALHEITWFSRDVDGCIANSLEYRSDLYSPRAIERIAMQLQTLLRAVAADTHCRLSQIQLLTAEERKLLLVDFNATSIDLDKACMAAQFERQAARLAGQVAVRVRDEALTYGELNRRANRLASRLRILGVGPGDRVGVCLDRSLDLVVALLAIQKAGAAYVPLDPGFPAHRLDYMLDDSGAGVIVTDGSAALAMSVPGHVTVVDLVADGALLASLADTNPETAPRADDPAYVIYTSGSTGRPKGVEVSQGALANFLGSMRREPGLSADDVVAALTTISFDIAGLELFLPLTVGARIELVPRETAVDGMALADFLENCAATVIQATPATWRLLLEAQWKPSRAVRALCGGEALPRDLADSLLERVHELWNLYGPTETTIWSTVDRVEPGLAPISIGRPIANTRVYVVDSHGEPVPIGMTGEIWIGGAGVAIGYHRQPDLTAERFVADTLSGLPGARLYRTGDLGRWGSDGRLYHLGRIDHQVKIRGFRIELGEIESLLASHESVRQAVVVGREAGPGDLRLVAYIAYNPGEDLTVSEVRRHLRSELPEYMLPSVVVALDSIPLTPNGKVDRAALPDPFRGAQRTDRQYAPPAPGLEQIMAQVWTDLLKVERVGADDNFFELGGHSLLSLRVVAAIEKQTGWRMDPRTLFFQTLRQIAAAASASIAKNEPVNSEGSLRK